MRNELVVVGWESLVGELQEAEPEVEEPGCDDVLGVEEGMVGEEDAAQVDVQPVAVLLVGQRGVRLTQRRLAEGQDFLGVLQVRLLGLLRQAPLPGCQIPFCVQPAAPLSSKTSSALLGR